MSSKWMLNRIGLIDFWYYDEEEFWFRDGRMLLRGSNGSGKSVTMQSFIPLLLDGNMRPERLDPFGSKARKMENYLLEEDDDRDERTGYLYMELKRSESESYITVGIGLRARRYKRLECWYFAIEDGRRIGYDFLLFKSEFQKIPNTKQELKNKLLEGGKLFESQSEYMQYVNQKLFGFETTEAYKELVDLLIQLRQPKLSKDFKPTIINDILSNSLAPMSEEDLRPMSEAIENMDSLKTNLDTLQDAITAAEDLEKDYDAYNQWMLQEKAKQYAEDLEALANKRAEQDKLFTSLEEKKAFYEQEKMHYQALELEEEVLKEEKSSLDESDATKLKEQEEQIRNSLLEEERRKKEKQQQEQRKTQDKKRLLMAIEKEERKKEEKWKQILAKLTDAKNALGQIPFDEFQFLSQELMEQKEGYEGFAGHDTLLGDYMAKVKKGLEVLKESERAKKEYSKKQEELEQKKEAKDKAERLCHTTKEALYLEKEALKEQIYQWNSKNKELHISESVLQEIMRRIMEYYRGSDYSEIKELVREAYTEKEEVLRGNLHNKNAILKEETERLNGLKAELKEWENQKDPEPELSDAEKKTREQLRELGIPFDAFYKVVNFDAMLSRKEVNRLEEAFLETGLLNALIISPEYKEQVLLLEGGCGHYLFGTVEKVRENICSVLSIDQEGADLFLYQRVLNVLETIGNGVESGMHTWIKPDGHYRIGAMEGTVSGQYEAHFVGAMQREQFRQKKVAELTLAVEAQKMVVASIEGEIREIREQLSVLKIELLSLPKESLVKKEAEKLADAEYALARIEKEIEKQQAETEQARREFEEKHLQAQKLCEACYMAAHLEVFAKAAEQLEQYRKSCLDIRILHSEFKNAIFSFESKREQMENLEHDFEALKMDLNHLTEQIQLLEAKLNRIREMLKQTDYEQIKSRLDYVVNRLSKLPKERERAVQNYSACEMEIAGLQEAERHVMEQIDRLEAYATQTREIFAEECKLFYVETEPVEDYEVYANRLARRAQGKNKRQVDYRSRLIDKYHEKKSFLVEYGITVTSLFGALEEMTERKLLAERIDFQVKYRGNSMSFKALLSQLKTDAQLLIGLLSDKDRELFEDILANTISKKIRAKIQQSKRWVENMNELMGAMKTSSGLTLSLKWKQKRAEKEEQLDTKVLVELLDKDVEIMREDEMEQMANHFRSKIVEAKKRSDDENEVQSFHTIMREILDYRKWFEFQLECQKTGEKKKELTDRVFFTFSGGEKAMAMYVPLFSAVVAKYAAAREDAPRLISLDEAFAGVDETNIRDMFRLMVEFEFNFMLNSQVLWGDYDTVPNLAIYQLVRPENAKFVTVISYVWNGRVRMLGDSLRKDG